MLNISKKSKNNIWFKVGVGLLLFACILWAGLLVVPFLPLSTGVKAGGAGILLVIGEVAFWLGAILTGKEFVNRYKKYFNPRNWKK